MERERKGRREAARMRVKKKKKNKKNAPSYR
jgi:hypothetical protein